MAATGPDERMCHLECLISDDLQNLTVSFGLLKREFRDV
jgi:hypothetical protein